MDKDSLTALLAQGLSVEKIGKRFGKHPSTVSYWMDKYGLAAPNREKHASKGGIERERLEELVGAGNTVAAIADNLGLSMGTVRLWLRRYGLQTVATQRVALAREAREKSKAGSLCFPIQWKQQRADAIYRISVSQYTKMRGSSMAERSAVNRNVVGSSPTPAAPPTATVRRRR